MPGVHACELPADALLSRYRDGQAYTDCFCVDIAQPVAQSRYVEAFYQTSIFKLERLLLAWFVKKPSTDAQARALADGADSFAAWQVESRTDDQLLLCDIHGRTRSWLMSSPLPESAGGGTRLFFGSAVVPLHSRSGQRSMGPALGLLLGFHKLYSRVLLHAAVSRLRRRA